MVLPPSTEDRLSSLCKGTLSDTKSKSLSLYGPVVSFVVVKGRTGRLRHPTASTGPRTSTDRPGTEIPHSYVPTLVPDRPQAYRSWEAHLPVYESGDSVPKINFNLVFKEGSCPLEIFLCFSS